MRVVLIIVALLLVAVSAAAVVFNAEPFRQHLSQVMLALAILVLIGVFWQSRQKAPPPTPAPNRPTPAPEQPQARRADAEIVHFLAMLQEKGRLVDFLMDDINAYSDAQVGAAARVVHAGCKGVLQEHFSINPVRAEQEGSTVQVPAGYSADEYRLVGKIVGIRALLRRACPPWLEDRYGEAAAVASRRRRPATRHRSRGGGSEMKPFGRPARPNHLDRDHQDANFHDSSLQSRDRPRHQQLRHGAG